MAKHTHGPYQREGRFIFKLVDNPEPKRGRPEQVNLWMAAVQPCGIAVETAELETVARLFQHAPDMLEALDKLARLGNGFEYGNSEGNLIAQAAIAKVLAS